MNGALAAPIVFAATFLASWIATRLVLAILDRRAILDHPNERSSHTRPTPRGGGLAVIAVALAAGAILGLLRGAETGFWLILAGTALLAALSWLDDLRDLPAGLRFFIHIVVVIAALTALPQDSLVFQGLLPPLADRVAAGVLWLWFVNLFNFMDGIDGISGVQTATLGIGLFLLTLLTSLDAKIGLLGLALAGAAAGFLLWNWHPARIFLGDVGSVPLGFLLGWLLLQAAIAGAWAAAAILPLYYLADATITLTRRALRGEKIWQAHRQHFYQRPVARGARHDRVALAIAGANLALVALAALAAVGYEAIALAVAAAVVALLLRHLVRLGRAA